jgi:hypothetical protein
MRTAASERRERLLDEWLDEWIEHRDETGATGAPTAAGLDTPHAGTPAPEVAALARASALLYHQVGTLGYVPAPEVAPVPFPHRFGAGTLLRIAAVVLLLAGLGVSLGIAESRTNNGSGPAGAVAGPCGAVRLVEPDGAMLPAAEVREALYSARSGGDPCPTLPVLWVRTSGARVGEQAKFAYVMEIRGRFFSDPFTHSTPHDVIWWVMAGNNASNQPEPITRLGIVHELYVEPVPPAPALPQPIEEQVSRTAAAAGDTAPAHPLRWLSLSLADLRAIAPNVRWAPASFTGSGYRAWVIELMGLFPGSAVAHHGLQPMFQVHIEGRGSAGVLSSSDTQFGTPAAWKPVADRLSGSDVNQQWLPVPVPQTLPSWVISGAAGDAKVNDAEPHALWVATTAGRIQTLDPYETAVPMGVPAVTPVWVVAMTSRLQGGPSPLFFVGSTDHPGGTRSAALDAGEAFDGIALSRFGTVHSLTLPSH